MKVTEILSPKDKKAILVLFASRRKKKKPKEDNQSSLGLPNSMNYGISGYVDPGQAGSFSPDTN